MMIKNFIYSLRFLIFVGVLFLLPIFSIQGQVLKLSDCYDWATSNFPLIQQLDLIERTKEYNLDNVAKGVLPKLMLSGQMTYQSAVTKLPIDLPNLAVPTLDKNQYKIYADAYVPLTERLFQTTQKEVLTLQAMVDKQKVEVNLHQVRERVQHVFFGVLLIETQIAQAHLLKKDLETAIEKTKAALENGTATTANADLLLAESYKVDQKLAELQANRRAFLNVLGRLIQKDLSDDTVLEKPQPIVSYTTLHRPEVALYEAQMAAIDAQQAIIKNRRIPSIGLFVQGGYGRPALNFLSNQAEFYYIGGLRFRWNLSSLYTNQNDCSILALNHSAVQTQKETFLFNTDLELEQKSVAIEKYRNLIAIDEAIIDVRERLKNTATVQLENGIITTLDYTNYLNAAFQAQQDLQIHQVYLLKAQYDYQTSMGL